MFFVNLEEKIKNISGRGVERFSIGKTLCGRNIWCVRIGNSGKKLIVQYSIHAREYITSMLSILHMKDMLKNKYNGIVYFVSIANPDGVALCMDGIDSVVDNTLKQKLLSVNGGKDFGLWKANARCVDLNVNFDADWGNGEKNIRYENGENYIGEYPNSENDNINGVTYIKITFGAPNSKNEGTYELEAETISKSDVNIGTTSKNRIIAILDFFMFCIRFLGT